jgi:hypothetical protein
VGRQAGEQVIDDRDALFSIAGALEDSKDRVAYVPRQHLWLISLINLSEGWAELIGLLERVEQPVRHEHVVDPWFHPGHRHAESLPDLADKVGGRYQLPVAPRVMQRLVSDMPDSDRGELS